MVLKPIKFSKMAKKKYFNVKNPDGLKRTILAETYFHAIAICVEKDGYKWSNSKYICEPL